MGQHNSVFRSKKRGNKEDDQDLVQKALKAAPSDHDAQIKYLTSLSVALPSRYDQTDALEDLDKAICVWRALCDAIPLSDPQRPDHIGRLGSMLVCRFSSSKDPKDLEESITLIQEAIGGSSRTSDRETYVLLLCTTLHQRWEHTENTAHLNEAVRAVQEHREILNTIPRSDLQREMCLSNYASMLSDRFVIHQELADLDSAINVMQEEGFDDPPETHPYQIHFLNVYGRLLRLRAQQTKSREDADNAIKIAEKTFKATKPGSSDWANCLNNLACRFATRYRLGQDIADLEEAIDKEVKALSAMNTIAQCKPAPLLSNLRGWYWMKYERTQSMDDLEKALQYGEQAVLATPSGHPTLSPIYTDLGSLQGLMYERTQNLEDLEMALGLLEIAGVVTPLGHPNRLTYLSSLSNMLKFKFEASGDLQDLEDSISRAEESAAIVRRNDRQEGLYFNNLGNLFGLKFELTGDMEDLQKAITSGRKAIEVTQSDEPDRPAYLNSLTRWLAAKARESGATEDLEIAIEMAQQAVQATPSYHRERHLHLNTLTNMIWKRYGHTEHSEDLEEAIKIQRDIVKSIPSDHRDRALIFGSLSDMLKTWVQREEAKHGLNDDARNLDEAVYYSRKALEATKPGNINRPMLLHVLAETLDLKYKLGRDLRDLEDAIKFGRQAVSETTDSDPNQALFKFKLAVILGTSVFEYINIDGNRIPWPDEATTLLVESFHSTNSPPSIRIRAGWMAGHQFATCGDWIKASEILDATVHLLPRLSLRWLPRDDQQRRLNNLSGLSALAASAALQTNRSVSDALEILEEGRGIIARLVMDHRSDLSELKRAHPTLAHEYQVLRDRISSPMTNSSFNYNNGIATSLTTASGANMITPIWSAQATVDQRRAYVNRLNELEDTIRTLPGFELFHQPLSLDRQITLEENEQLVTFNVSEYRSDALIVNKMGSTILPLPELQIFEVERCARELVGNGKLSQGNWQTEDERNEKLRKILRWLWDVAVHPVLEFLGLLESKSTERLPRIWWLVSGYMGLLPLHAAGDFEEDGSWNQTTSLFAISSYTTTLKSLHYARTRKLRHLCEIEQKVLVVAMPETFGACSLDTDREIENIQESIEPTQPKILSLPTKNEVLTELRDSTVVHFACHGISNSYDPSKCALLLKHVESDKNDHLTMPQLADIDNSRAQIAYLSACSTAENAAEGLMDEAIHIASAFQLIGFPHVIGTMWESNDEYALEVARLFYRILVEKMNENDWSGSHSIVAEALHESMEILKEDNMTNFLGWAPFIHLGA